MYASRPSPRWSALLPCLIVLSFSLLASCGGDAPLKPAPVVHDAGGFDLAPRDGHPRQEGPTEAIVGLGTRCGLPNQRCCDANFCANGGCCVGGRCVEGGKVCAAPALPGDGGAPPPVGGVCQAGSCGGCGGPGQRCCEGGLCTSGANRCVNGTCAGCGWLGELCCGGSCVEPGTVCNTNVGGTSVGTCLKCGEPGTPCCAGDACNGQGCCYSGLCVAAGGACGGDGGKCQAKSCSGCSRLGQPCCGSTCASDGPQSLSCNNAHTCIACGGTDQPCCRSNTCGEGLGCVQPQGDFGRAGDPVCKPCGQPGGPCCSRSPACQEGGCCVSGACVANGAVCGTEGGFGPLAGLGKCTLGRCDGCGTPGQTCCRSNALPAQSACAGPVGSTTFCATANDLLGTPPPSQGMSQPSMCLTCGEPGTPCCGRNVCNGGCCSRDAARDYGTCVAEGTACAMGGTCAAKGSCGTCGGVGQKCCPGSQCSASETTCRLVADKGETCVACGGPGQPCCYDQRTASLCRSGASCRSGICLER